MSAGDRSRTQGPALVRSLGDVKLFKTWEHKSMFSREINILDLFSKKST